MMAETWIFDALLAVLLPFLAWRLLTHPDLFRAVVLFIVFGLLLSLVWVRLQAPDVALAEAAIGAGLTGALFLNALGHIRAPRTPAAIRNHDKHGAAPDTALPERRLRFVLTHALLALLSGAIGLMLFQVILDLPLQSPGLTAEVQNSLPYSGVTNPVTAVLLNFRGYDTLLEIAVLLLAVFGVWSLASPTVLALSSSWSLTTATPVLVGLVRVLLPILLLISTYLLWLGAFAPGGAFQGGAVLAAGGLLLLLSNQLTSARVDKRFWRFLLVFGFGVFLIVAVGVLPFTGHLLAYPSGRAGGLILLIEATLTVSIACILITLFIGGPSR